MMAAAKRAKKRGRPRKTPNAAHKDFEREAWERGLKYVAGVDEVGRGPVAGPVVAAAVIMPAEVHVAHVTDSKKLWPEEREALAYEIKRKAVAWAVGVVPAPMIDACNILRATHLAMREALRALDPAPELILVDGWALPDIEFPQHNIIDGDAKCFSIAAASIVAKVARDRIMSHLDTLYPQYGFAAHKGYACAPHLEAIEQYGPCPVHRMSFSPFSAEAQEQFDFDDEDELDEDEVGEDEAEGEEAT